MAVAAREGGRPVFASLQVGRGIAALLVVLYHADKIVAAPGYWHAQALGGLFACGHAGVQFFFVLSGFIIAHAHRADIGRPERLGKYATRRFVRVVPLYWLVLAALFVSFTTLGVPRSVDHLDATAIVSSIVLAGPDAHGGVLTVSWTLFHELFFYLVFAALIADRRLGTLLVAVWLSLIAAAAAGAETGLPRYVTSPLNLLFFVGVLVRVTIDAVGIPTPRTLAAVGAAAFAGLALEEVFAPAVGPLAQNLCYGVAAAVLVAGLAAAERRAPLRPGRSALLLGAASYSIYLVHYPALSVAARAMMRLGLGGVPPAVALVALTVVVTALGVAVHLVVERPLVAWFARKRGPVLPAGQTVAA